MVGGSALDRVKMVFEILWLTSQPQLKVSRIASAADCHHAQELCKNATAAKHFFLGQHTQHGDVLQRRTRDNYVRWHHSLHITCTLSVTQRMSAKRSLAKLTASLALDFPKILQLLMGSIVLFNDFCARSRYATASPLK